ncbi:MAG: transglycosylase domain-containing protein [Coriobacteriia bacterium]|nr:transglycosylase domain-containing protein [Coriobacteriia bacterium]
MGDDVGPLQKYFGRYSLEARDVALVELEESLRQAGNQSQFYGQLANVLLAVSTIVGSLLAASSPPALGSLSQPQRMFITVAASAILAVLLMFFAEIQKTIVLSSRKVVTLRCALGLDYTHLQLTLQNWRIEGATNPFAIRLFPGWGSPAAFPFWVVCAIITGGCYFFLRDLQFTVEQTHVVIAWWISAVLVCAVLGVLFRQRLLDIHETLRLRIIYIIAGLLRIRLLTDFAGVLFRGKLAVSEMRRLGFESKWPKKLVVALEDNRFYEHGGVDLRALGRAVLSQFACYRRSHHASRSGASTLTMQLARTLLVEEYSKTARRKLMEILLATWLEDQFTKNELLDLYLVSVRFATDVNGLPAAIKYYFGSAKKRSTSPQEAFLLIERLSNVRNRILSDKIAAQIGLACERVEGFDSEGVSTLYEVLVSKQILDGHFGSAAA